MSRNVFLSLFFQDWASTEKEFGGEPEKAADRREKEEDKTPSVGADPNTTVTLPVIDQVIFFCRSMSRQLARHRCFIILILILSLYTRTTPRRHTSFLLSTTRTEFWLFPIRYTQRV